MTSAHVIVRNTPRPDPRAVELLAGLGVATGHEAMGRRGLTHPVLRPIYPGARVAGRAVTVLSQPGDNLMIHACIEQCGPGDVLVVTTTSPSTDGMFGELFATQLRYRGVAGLVIDAGVRDVAELTTMGFPVWSRAVSAQGTVKATPGSVNVPVVLAGVQVEPGDVVVADDDGVLVVPCNSAVTVAERAEERHAREQDKIDTFATGVLGLELYDLRPTLAELGVVYQDHPAGDGPPPTTRPTKAPDAAEEIR